MKPFKGITCRRYNQEESLQEINSVHVRPSILLHAKECSAMIDYFHRVKAEEDEKIEALVEEICKEVK